MTDEKKTNGRTEQRQGALVGAMSQAQGPVSIPMGGMSRPKVGSSIMQLCLQVLDVSSSMSGSIGELIAASTDLTTELAGLANRGAFHIGTVVYGSKAAVHLTPKPATAVDPQELVVSSGMVGGSTNMRAGLAAALEVVEKAAANAGNWARPMAVLMSDGCPDPGNDPEPIATTLKAKADIVCVAFGSHADLALLQRLATTPQHAFTAATGADLRKFFATVGRTMSQAARTGQSVASLLGGPNGSVLRG